MEKINRVLALWERSENGVRDVKLAYLHRNAQGDTLVDGEPMKLRLHRAGSEAPREAGCLAIVHDADERFEPRNFFAVNGGETLLRVADEMSGQLEVVNSGFIGVSSRYEQWRPIRAGVVTISDKGSEGLRKDEAGPLLSDLIGALGADVENMRIVPDDRTVIGGVLKEWADAERLHLILTTGGTGLSRRDVTPEAFGDVAEKFVPGIGEAMRLKTMPYTEKSFLTRSVAVVRGDTLMIAFPGSTRAVRQCFEAVAPFLRHGLDILQGWDAECGGHNH